MLHLKKPVETEIEIKKSRFIGMLFPVENEQQARETLALVRKQHPSATHHCTAMMTVSPAARRDCRCWSV